MRCRRIGQVVLAISVAVAGSVAAQGRSGRGAPAQAPTPDAGQQGTAGRGTGRGGPTGGGGAAGAGGLYTYDVTAPAGMAIPDTPPVETHQKITINGEALAYTTRAGYLALRNATTGQPAAHLFFTAYLREGVGDASTRPLIVFMGGAPGVAAHWQEFGGLGPKRMKWAADGTAGSPPYGWVENPATLLAQSDLVFVNPVGTSYSRPDQPARGPEFWTTPNDVASLGEFVRGLLASYDRRNSPLFVAGEDAGTPRAAGVAAYLLEHQVPVSGVILLSVGPSADSIAGDEQYITLLPSLALAAWHHKKLSPELQALGADQVAEQARQFASREYLHALYRGDRMKSDERTKAVAALSRLTGLSTAFVVSNNLRISAERFSSELLRDEHRALATSDSRVAGYRPAATGGGRGGGGGGGGAVTSLVDVNRAGQEIGFSVAYESYLRKELGFTGGAGVLYMSGGGVGTYTASGSDDASLAAAFARNPRLRVFAGVSYFDLAVPFYAAEFTLAHLNIAPDVYAHNLTLAKFESGGMTYVDARSRTRLHDTLAKFIADAVAPLRGTRP